MSILRNNAKAVYSRQPIRTIVKLVITSSLKTGSYYHGNEMILSIDLHRSNTHVEYLGKCKDQI